MNEKISALYSEYVIDGISREMTPYRILSACLADSGPSAPSGSFDPVVDESVDPALKPCITDPALVNRYYEMSRMLPERKFPMSFPETYTKNRIAFSLIDTIWREGHFRLDDLSLRMDWKWCPGRIGDMTAFYASVCSAADYIDSLGLKLSGYSCVGSGCEQTLSVMTGLSAVKESDCTDDFFDELPFSTEHPSLGDGLLRSTELLDDSQSWIIYIPFENCDYRLGASRLAQALGVSGAVAPQIIDADYFIDCYEVVRELVEDGIVISGATAGDGGLMAALRSLSRHDVGMDVELADLSHATHEEDIVRLLFSEVPGVVIQIADIDYDYVDAELLLQDVAFFPLGHPVSGRSDVSIRCSGKTGIQNILESLIQSQSSEGED